MGVGGPCGECFERPYCSALAGRMPESEHGDDRGVGCPCAIEEASEIRRVFDKTTDERMRRMHVVCGAYTGDIPAKPGEKVVFIGDCAEWKGQLHGKPVEIPNVYKDRATHDPHTATHEDIFTKLASAKGELGGEVIRREGGPVSFAEHVLALLPIGKT